MFKSSSSLIRWFLFTLLLLALKEIPMAEAQVMRGRVVGDESGAPIGGVSISLVDSQDRVVKTTLSGESGLFVLQAPRTGRFRIRLEMIGYAESTSSEVDLLPPDTVEVELQLTVEPVPLSPLTIISDRRPLVIDTRLASWGYYDRRARFTRLSSGVSHFLGVDEIRKKGAMRVTDVFKDLSGIRVQSLVPCNT